jgi:hypothetical protein
LNPNTVHRKEIEEKIIQWSSGGRELRATPRRKINCAYQNIVSLEMEESGLKEPSECHAKASWPSCGKMQ